MTSINILFHNPAAGIGGSERSLLALLDSASMRDQTQVTVCCPPDGALQQALAQRDISMLPMATPNYPWWRRPLTTMDTVRRLTRIIRDSGAQVVVCNLAGMALHMLLAARLAGVRFVYVERFVWRTPPPVIHRWMLERTDGVLFVSHHQRESSLALCPGLRLNDTVLHNPVAPPSEPLNRTTCREQLGLKGTPFRIGVIGRLTADKGLEGLPLILAMLKKRIPDTELLLVGDDGGHPENRMLMDGVMAEAEALGVGGMIRAMGFRTDVERCMAACDVVLIPSKGESFGRVAVEALAAGCPVVCSELGALREIVGDSGAAQFCPLGDWSAFARSLEGLALDPWRRVAMAHAGQQWARRHFDADAYGEAYLAWLMRLLSLPIGPFLNPGMGDVPSKAG